MTTESSPYELIDADLLEPTQKIVTVAREKNTQKWMRYKEQTTAHTDFPGIYDLSVVVPTRNEHDNVQPLLEALHDALHDLCVEVIFVDDSDDDTPEIITNVAETMNSSLFHIRLEHRLAGAARSGGLATAVVYGMNKAQAHYVAVIDADLQHPPDQLRVFYEQAGAHNIDLALASRYIKGGSYQGLDGAGRRLISVGMKWTARLLFPERLWRISDPLGGFFLLRRSLLTDVSLRPIGYKILLEILLRCQWKDVLEIPYHFRARAHGQSKANMMQGIMALHHMLRLLVEVPYAGRIWKISLLVLLNVFVTFILFITQMLFPLVWSNLFIIVFVAMTGLDFFLLNRFVFPSLITTSNVEPSTPVSKPVEDGQTEKKALALPIKAFEDTEASTQAIEPSEEKETLTPLTETSMSAESLIQVVKITEETEDLTEAIEATEKTEDLTEAVETTEKAEILTQSVEISEIELSPTIPNQVSTSELREKTQALPKKKILKKLEAVVAAVAVALAVGWISYTIPGVLLVMAVLCIGAAILFTKDVKRDHMVTMLLAIAVGVSSIDYLSWRFVVTNWQGWWISVPLLFAETLGAIHAFGFQITIWPWSPPKIGRGDDPTQHPIFIFIPTVNEGVTILRPTLEGVLAARDKYLASYPHGKVTIVVCNDGRVANVENWEEIDILAQELGVCCVTRTRGGGAKAGNIENARQELQATNDAFLVIFDADQVAKPDFLLKTIPPFRDPRMGWVQTGQYYANLDNPVSRWADDQQSMFYNLLCPGKAALNAAFICGTNVVIRAAALDEIGGLPQDSVTEDFAASIALHPSWRSIYLSDVLATGLGPLDIPSYLKQQSRWAIGTLSVFRSHWRKILLPNKHGLKSAQRFQYFLACTHYLCGLRDLIYLISPILFIFTGIPAVRGSTLTAFLLHFIPYCVLSFTALWYSSRGITGLRGIVIGFGCFPVLIESLLSVILKRKVGFAVTSKKRDGKRSLNYLSVYCFCFLLCIVCLFWATQVKSKEQTSLFISILWVVYSMVMLASFLWLNYLDIRFHAAVLQSGTTNETVANQPYPAKLLNRKRGLNPVWNLGLSALIACPMLMNVSLTMFTDGASRPFVIGQEKRATPYFGVSLPVQLLKDWPPTLEHDLGTQFAIVGRTQDIHDQFDTAWANQLAAQHARPWITLQFGVFGADHKPPLDANFPAIINGLHDQKIRAWAEAIRSYGKPVYLTIFLHADRNWSLSSGVANGGIPQDVSATWLHVQSVFRQAGANNVAWVWAPADPLHDQIYAPPASTIDAVLQSFINYPGTKWGDPDTVLRNLTMRYPKKPIIVEASASGPSAQKAEWLTKLGQAVNDFPQVHALLYHEGGPELNATKAQIKSWSLTSDPYSLAAMQKIVLNLRKKMQPVQS
jgi:cellulose synthase (UDP-forming)